MQQIDAAWKSIIGNLEDAPVILAPLGGYCEYCGISIPMTEFCDNVCAECLEMEYARYLSEEARKEDRNYCQITFCQGCGMPLRDEDIKIDYQYHSDVHASEALYAGYRCQCGFEQFI